MGVVRTDTYSNEYFGGAWIEEHSTIAGDRTFYRLIGDDGNWHEDYPDRVTALTRLHQYSLLKTGDIFEQSYDEFLRSKLHWLEYSEWRARKYVDRLRWLGYEANPFNSGGGIILIETVYKGMVAWADTDEGHARIGLYPLKGLEDGEPSVMVNFESNATLEAWHADWLVDLIRVMAAAVASDITAWGVVTEKDLAAAEREL